MKKKSLIAICICVTLLASIFVLPVKAKNIVGEVIGGTAISVVVDSFGDQIDSFINSLLKKDKFDTKAATKVVTIISLGSGSAVGAAQITGDKSKVDQVKACVQIESNKTFGSPVRIRVLIPVDKKSVKNVSRVDGVGVSSLIDIKF